MMHTSTGRSMAMQAMQKNQNKPTRSTQTSMQAMP